MYYFMDRNFTILNLMMRKLCFVKYMEVILIEQPISSVEGEPTVPQNMPQQERNVQPVGATHKKRLYDRLRI